MSDFIISDSILGKDISVPVKYNPSFLFRIPRSENRGRYGISSSELPFTGVDVWNCYEVSFLTDNGLPVNRILKLIYSAESTYIVESKSLKLYLYSFNMENLGSSIQEAEQKINKTITSDLNQLLETEVIILLFDDKSFEKSPFLNLKNKNLIDLLPENTLNALKLTEYKESPSLLKSNKTDLYKDYSFRTDLLRSNCRVTNQPDWGDLFVIMKTKHVIDLSSIVAYLVSFRQENHFHEEVVEIIYKRFKDYFEPENLVVAAMYTRRGGIDINPIRVSDPNLLDNSFISKNFRLAKTLRQ